MYNKKAGVRIYSRISHETTMVANIIWDLLRASNFRKRELGLAQNLLHFLDRTTMAK